ncbi:hypothetical protein CSOJ01_15574 [Colletotrichum sojae]|uniref:F-box domain-containing protein n=1 Tax=Colletotrichum sojae TaxID=2175907 RepID=A0A8H6MHH1_9PEZI|nr:hypothetical protein CSOJ01_15574 [Colletotrichum sojae]
MVSSKSGPRSGESRYLEYRRQDDVKTLPQHLETTKQLEAQLPLSVAYAHYVELLAQQEQVLSTAADLTAFDWALENNRFPNLNKINLTPAAHGILFKPLYPTPAFRALPYGFNYPLPRGWPAGQQDDRSPYEDWDHDGSKHKWRGFLHVPSSLARQGSTRLQELILDGNQVWSGLTCGLFHASEPCAEYDNLVSVITKPGFTTLRLSLMVCSMSSKHYLAFRNGRLKQALDTDLRSFFLETDEECSPEQVSLRSYRGLDHFVPFRSIFPIDAWKSLAHVGLSRFVVKQQDLLSFLAAMPQTLRSVELSFLWYLRGTGNYRDLLFGIRDELGWEKRPAKPRLLIRYESASMLAGRAIWLEDELNDFLYNGGENPYIDPSSPDSLADDALNPVVVRDGFGKEKDVFEPRFERPYDSPDKLIQLGILKGWDED